MYTDPKQLPHLWLVCNFYSVLSCSLVWYKRMQTPFHWQLLWKHSPLQHLLEKKTGKRLLFLISAWVNSTPRISALTVPVEMPRKNTVPGKMYRCGPSPQAELTIHFRFEPFQKFSCLNKAIMFWLLAPAIAAQVSIHMIAERREEWCKLNIQHLLKWLRRESHNLKMVSWLLSDPAFFCHSPHTQTKQIRSPNFTCCCSYNNWHF